MDQNSVSWTSNIGKTGRAPSRERGAGGDRCLFLRRRKSPFIAEDPRFYCRFSEGIKTLFSTLKCAQANSCEKSSAVFTKTREQFFFETNAVFGTSAKQDLWLPVVVVKFAAISS